MARVKVGGSTDDYIEVLAPGGIVRRTAATVEVADRTTLTPLTDLLLNGAPVTTIPVPSTGLVPEFELPDGVTPPVAVRATPVGGTTPGPWVLLGESATLNATAVGLAVINATDGEAAREAIGLVTGTPGVGEVELVDGDLLLTKPTSAPTERQVVTINTSGAQEQVAAGTLGSGIAPTRNMWSMGDSLTLAALTYDNTIYGSLSAAGPALQYQPAAWQTWALLASQCRWTHVGVHATAGLTAAQILATHVPNVIAAATPGDTVVVLAGTNGNVLADVKTIHTTLRAAGLRTVAVTIPPSTSSTLASVAGFNEGLKRWAAAKGIPLADAHAALVDTATGNYLAAYNSGDGVHPNTAGYKVLGETIAATLNTLWDTAVTLVNHNAAHTGQLKTNPLALSALSAGTDYYHLSGAGTSTVTQGTVAGMIGGKSYRLTRGDTNLNTVLGNSTLVAGNRVRLGYALQFTPAGGGSFGLRWESNTTGGKILFGLGYPTETLLAIGLSRFYVELTVPTLPDYVYRAPRISLTGSGSVLDVGEVTAYDLTAMGAL